MSILRRSKRAAEAGDLAPLSPVEPVRGSRAGGIGDLLRETRERSGQSLDEMAAVLCIRPSQLAAIEEGRFGHLPGQVYALGFIRTYALHLGLDGDEAVRRFKQETAGQQAQRDLSFPAPLAERSIAGGRMVLVALVLAVCGYGLWYYVSSSNRERPVRVAEVPAELMPPPAAEPEPAAPVAPAAAAPEMAPAETPQAVAALAPPPAAPTSPLPPAPSSTPPVVAAAVAPPSAGVVGEDASPSPGAAAALPPVPGLASPAAAAAAPGRVFGDAAGPVRIVIRATADSWLQVRDADENLVAQRLLHAGDTYRVPDKPGLVMRTGNGSGLEIVVDGRPAPRLGGAIRRNVMLDPARLLAGNAAE